MSGASSILCSSALPLTVLIMFKKDVTEFKLQVSRVAEFRILPITNLVAQEKIPRTIGNVGMYVILVPKQYFIDGPGRHDVDAYDVDGEFFFQAPWMTTSCVHAIGERSFFYDDVQTWQPSHSFTKMTCVLTSLHHRLYLYNTIVASAQILHKINVLLCQLQFAEQKRRVLHLSWFLCRTQPLIHLFIHSFISGVVQPRQYHTAKGKKAFGPPLSTT